MRPTWRPIGLILALTLAGGCAKNERAYHPTRPRPTTTVVPATSVAETAAAPTSSTSTVTAPASPATSSSTTEAPTSAVPATTTIPTRPPVGDALAPRACYTVDAARVASAASCDDLHDGQVIGTGLTLAGVEPTESDPAVWQLATVAACTDQFETFTGASLDPGAVNFYTIGALVVPPLDGPATVVCTVLSADGNPWAGSAESLDGSYAGLAVGSCIDFPTPTADVVAIPCDQPHEAEVYVVDAPVLVDAADAPFPTPAEWDAIAELTCGRPFLQYTGLVADETNLTYTYSYGSEQSWLDVSQRVMTCFIINYDGTRLVGSTRV